MEKSNTHLIRALGLKETLAVIISRIIGSGIFRTSGTIFIISSGLILNEKNSNESFEQISLALFFLVWVVGAISTLLSSFCYAEMISMYPSSGGPYIFLKKAYPEIVTFLRGWAMFFVGETASIVAVSIVFCEFLDFIVSAYIPKYISYSFAYILIWAFTLSACFGVKLSAWLQNILGVLKIVVLVVMICILFGIDGSSKNLTEHILPKNWNLGVFISLFGALRYVFFSFSGWEGATYIAEEVKNPKKNLPLSLFLGISFVSILYIVINLGYLYQLGPHGMIDAGKGVAMEAIKKTLGLKGSLVLAIFILVSTATNVNTQIFVKSRTWFAMARDNLFFSPAAKLNSVYHTPNNSLIFQAIWATVLLTFALIQKNSYEVLIDYFSFTSSLFNIFTLFAVVILRKKNKQNNLTNNINNNNNFKVPLLPLVLTIVLLIQGSFLVVTIYDKPLESLIGMTLTLSGIIYYFYKKRQVL